MNCEQPSPEALGELGTWSLSPRILEQMSGWGLCQACLGCLVLGFPGGLRSTATDFLNLSGELLGDQSTPASIYNYPKKTIWDDGGVLTAVAT